MEIDIDVYENLPNDEPILQEEVEKLQHQIQLLEAHIEALEADIAKLCAKVNEMKKVRENLEKNISELYKTARAEIDRKDKMISDLRGQLDQMIFRKKSNHTSSSFPAKRPRESCLSANASENCAKKPRKEYDSRKSKRSPSPRRRSRSRSRSKEKHRRSHRERSRDRKKDYKSDGSDEKKSHSNRDNSAKTKSSVPKTITNRRDTNEQKTVSSVVVGSDTLDKLSKENKICAKIIPTQKDSEKHREIQISKEKDKVRRKSETKVPVVSIQNLERENGKEMPPSEENVKMKNNILVPDTKGLEKEIQMSKESNNSEMMVQNVKDLALENVKEVQETTTSVNVERGAVMPNLLGPEREKVNQISTKNKKNSEKVELIRTPRNLQESEKEKKQDRHCTRFTVLFGPEEEENLEEKRTIETNIKKTEVRNTEKMHKTHKTKPVIENKPKAKARIEVVTTKLKKRLVETNTAQSVSCVIFEPEQETNEPTLDTNLRDIIRDVISDTENVESVKKTAETDVEKGKKCETTTSIFPANVTSTYSINNKNIKDNVGVMVDINHPSTQISSHGGENNEIINASKENSINPTETVKNDAVIVKTVVASAKEANKHENKCKQTSKQNVSEKSGSVSSTEAMHTQNMEVDENSANYSKNNKPTSKQNISLSEKSELIVPIDTEKNLEVNKKENSKHENGNKNPQMSKDINERIEAIKPLNPMEAINSKIAEMPTKENSKLEHEKQVTQTSQQFNSQGREKESVNFTNTIKNDPVNLKLTKKSAKKENSKNDNKTKQLSKQIISQSKSEATKNDVIDSKIVENSTNEDENKVKQTSKTFSTLSKEGESVNFTDRTKNAVVNLEVTNKSAKKENSKNEDKTKQPLKQTISLSNKREPAKNDVIATKVVEKSTNKENSNHENEIKVIQTSKPSSSLSKESKSINSTDSTKNEVINETAKKENNKGENKSKQILMETSLSNKTESLPPADATKNDAVIPEIENSTKKENSDENQKKVKQTLKQIGCLSKESESVIDPANATKNDTPILEISEKLTKKKANSKNENKTKTSEQTISSSNKSESVTTTEATKNAENSTNILKENIHEDKNKKQTSDVDKKKDVKSAIEVKSKKSKDRRDSRERTATNVKKDRCEEEVPESDRVLRSAVRREKLEKSNEKIMEEQTSKVASISNVQENASNKDATKPMLPLNEFISCVGLTHEGEIPVLHLSDSDPSTNDGNLFDVNLNIENCPPVTSTPSAANIDMRLLQDDLNISFNESGNKSSNNFEISNMSLSGSLNGSAMNNSVVCSPTSALNTSSARKRKRIVVTWS